MTAQPHPMTTAELRAAMRAIVHTDTTPPPAHTWDRHRWELRKHVERDNPEEMLTWSTLHATMFVGDAPFVRTEYGMLARLPDYQRWDAAIVEHPFGNPPRLPYATYASGNTVHQATHAATFERLTGLRLDKLGSIIEFGGGFGAMRALVHRLGFRGDYTIYDTPEYSLLQRYYLSHVMMPGYAMRLVEVVDGEFAAPGTADLLIACYSISEVPTDIRNRFLKQADVGAYLFAIQDCYMGVDLPKTFKAYIDSRPDVAWSWEANPYLPGHVYLAGVRCA